MYRTCLSIPLWFTSNAVIKQYFLIGGGGGVVDEYIDRRSAASSAALSSGTGGPIRTRDNRYVMMQAIKDEGL